MSRNIVKRAIKAAGGPAEVARKITELTGKPITTQAVSQWPQIPVGKVKVMETISGFPRYKLRPDIYDPSDAHP